MGGRLECKAMSVSAGAPRKSSSIDYLIRKGSVITLITLISRPLGYVREAFQAYLFGATLLVDAFEIGRASCRERVFRAV
jgi:hypothetical protein